MKIVTQTEYQKGMLRLALTMVAEQALSDGMKSEARDLLKQDCKEIEISKTHGMEVGLDCALSGALRALSRRIGQFDDYSEDRIKAAKAEITELLAQFRQK